MTILCVDTGAGPPVPTLLQTQCAGHAGPDVGGVPWVRAAYGHASRQGPEQRLRYRREDGVRRALPVVGSALQPLGATGPDRTCLRRGTHQPAGKAAPDNATGGSHGQYSGFPRWSPRAILLVPTQSNIHALYMGVGPTTVPPRTGVGRTGTPRNRSTVFRRTWPPARHRSSPGTIRLCSDQMSVKLYMDCVTGTKTSTSLAAPISCRRSSPSNSSIG
ncbi:hypothetical protein J2T21_003004 [Paeniglutamicibacter psychrophenolicus]|nr:hypothetical protein [Paeniglutamicibacter psychrophenolicus]